MHMDILKRLRNQPGLMNRVYLLTLVVFLHTPVTVIAQKNVAGIETPVELTPANQKVDERELTAEEDPLAERESDKDQREDTWYKEPNTVRVYGSARLRYRDTGSGPVWGDGGSRAGIETHWQVLPKRWLFGGLEVGFNLLDRIDQLIDRGSASGDGEDRSDIFERLAYIGFEGPNLLATIGKNWSSYYKVASFTDRFQGAGGSAGGAFNANTDGGPTGTGRADKVLQTRFYIDFFPDALGIKPFNLNVQAQHGEPVPGIDDVNYGTTLGASAILNTQNDFTLGIAYNHADIRDLSNPAVVNAGIDGDAQALVIGSRWQAESWYLGAIVSRLLNHETTDTLSYFDGTGSELYAQYQAHGPWWITGGYNWLQPDDDELQAGQYKIEYGLVGMRYSVDKFRKMFYINARISNSRASNGDRSGNIYTVGVRWDLEKTFSWAPFRGR